MNPKQNTTNSALSQVHLGKKICWWCAKTPPTYMYKGKLDPYYYYFCDEHIKINKTLDDCVITRLVDGEIEICKYSKENDAFLWLDGPAWN